MNNNPKINFNLEGIFATMQKAISRAYLFSNLISQNDIGKSINKIHSDDMTSIKLTEFNINDKEAKDELISTFKQWNINNCYCELIEKFEYLMKELYFFLKIAENGKVISPNYINEIVLPKTNKFAKEKFYEKTKKLFNLLDINKKDDMDLLLALQTIRNSLNHDNEIMNRKLKESNGAILSETIYKIPQFEFFLQNEDGIQEVKLPFKTKKSGDLILKINYKDISIKNGECIALKYDNLIPICFKINLICYMLKKQTIQFLENRNIK